MELRVPGLTGELLRELDIARMQLLALAEAVPGDLYGWSPANGTRSFSAVLVHIAAANLGLLEVAGYPPSEIGESSPLAELIRKSIALERTLTAKQEVMDFLTRSFDAVQESFLASRAGDLERPVEFLGEPATVRRVCLRMLVHTHEHMGQAIAYTRTKGIKVPWPDPLSALDN
jgi:hypothetical protein